jgi:O-antigen/teichoic acid export membrane protein
MIRKILGTITTRILVAALSLAIILVNARVLGAEKVGTISLIILAISIIQLLNGIVGGAALVYLVPRQDAIRLLIPAYLWAIITAVAGTGLLNILHLFPWGSGLYVIPEGYSIHVMMLSMIFSLASVNFMVLMGQEKIRAYNTISLLQVACLFAGLMIFFVVFHRFEVEAYIRSLYIAYSFAFIAGFIWMIPSIRYRPKDKSTSYLKQVFRLGSVMQLANILQFLNYRVSYYFLDFFLNRAAVGVYSVGVQLSESIWIIAKSIHMVQYTRISNEGDKQYAVRLTLNLVKVSFLATITCLILVLTLIYLLFPLIFKPAFIEVFPVMLALSPGILVFSVSIILSPYFSGSGRPVHNTISSAIGLFFTLVFSLILIPVIGLRGAAWAASMAYLFATVYQLVVFVRDAKVGLSDFILRKKDVNSIRDEVKVFLQSKKPVQPEDPSVS